MNHTIRRLLFVFAVALLLQSFPTTADARPGAGYVLTEILIPGQPVVQPQGIANNGTIVGYSGDSADSISGADDVHGFVLRNGALSRVDRPGTRFTYLTGVNEAGLASGFTGAFNQAGFVVDPGGIHGFTYDGATFADVVHELDGGTFNVTFVTDLNSSGRATGFSVDGNGTPFGFTWEDGAATTIYGPTGGATYGSAITDSGTVLIGAGTHSQLLRNGSYEDIDFGALGVPLANDVNNPGTVVGSYQDDTGRHGFVLRHGEVTTVDWPGATETHVNGINNQGDIVGEFLVAGVWHGFVGRRS